MLQVAPELNLLDYVKSVRIRSFSGPNAEKYGPEKLRMRTLHAVFVNENNMG